MERQLPPQQAIRVGEEKEEEEEEKEKEVEGLKDEDEKEEEDDEEVQEVEDEQSLSQYCNSVDKVRESARVISASIKNVVNRVSVNNV